MIMHKVQNEYCKKKMFWFFSKPNRNLDEIWVRSWLSSLYLTLEKYWVKLAEKSPRKLMLGTSSALITMDNSAQFLKFRCIEELKNCHREGKYGVEIARKPATSSKCVWMSIPNQVIGKSAGVLKLEKKEHILQQKKPADRAKATCSLKG